MSMAQATLSGTETVAESGEQEDDERVFPEGETPWEDVEEPWEDAELMLKMKAHFDYQYEVAEELGITESKCAYWMGKHRENYEPEPDPEEYDCTYIEVCGNESLNPNSLCSECLRLARFNDSKAGKRGETYIERSEYDDMVAFMKEVHEVHG